MTVLRSYRFLAPFCSASRPSLPPNLLHRSLAISPSPPSMSPASHSQVSPPTSPTPTCPFRHTALRVIAASHSAPATTE